MNEATRWSDDPNHEAMLVARNVSTRYLAILAEMAVGLLVLPFNVAHLGKSAYGLWMLTTSVTAYFSVLDLGYAGAQVKFVALYRAKRDVNALNEILSTMFCAFTAIGVVMYLAAIAVALGLGRLFHLDPEQVRVGRIVLLVVSANVAVSTSFSVFGGVINGFQRYDLNNIVGTISSLVTAAVNVAVLLAGYGLITLVVATTVVRLLALFVYRANAYRVFPALRVRPRSFSVPRLKEVTSFSVHGLLIDWSNKVNYSIDALVIGMFLNTSAVTVWSVGQRIADTTQRLTNQLNDVLFPNVVDNDTADRFDRLQQIFLIGTRLSLATVIPIAGATILLARPLLAAWIGSAFTDRELDIAIAVLQVLTLAVIVRIGAAMAGTLLKGAGRHRLLAITNVAMAIANLSLSVALVRPLGLAGVAISTLIPVGIGSWFVLFPAGCARVGLSTRHAFVEAVWPAVWPGVLMAATLWFARPYAGASLPAVGLEACAAAALYAIVFLRFGTTTDERDLIWTKVSALRARPRVFAPPAVSEDA